jgi:hypothetical protein
MGTAGPWGKNTYFNNTEKCNEILSFSWADYTDLRLSVRKVDRCIITDCGSNCSLLTGIEDCPDEPVSIP